MTQNINDLNIDKIECRFAVHCPTPQDMRKDLHLVKEQIITKDGEIVPNVRLIWDFKRDYYITKPGFQNHNSKKEWESLDKLTKFQCTQSNLTNSIGRAIGQPGFRGTTRTLYRNPYVYGADIQSTALIKQRYSSKYPGDPSRSTLCALDIETDVVGPVNKIIMCTISFKSKVCTIALKSFYEGHARVEERVKAKLLEYLGDYVEKRKINHEFIMVDDDIDIVRLIFKKLHEWKPDFLAIWNITYDLKKILECLEWHGVDPKDIMSDPIVPNEYKFFKFKEGPKQKVTASGKVTPIKPAAQWHTVYTPSSFYFIDAMCAFKHIRTGEQDKSSYALDEILDDTLKIRKLKFKEADGYIGLEWHQFMQKNYPIEYTIYNVFDCVAMEELDEKTTDLCFTLPMLSRYSDYENFKSQPRRLVDDLHFILLKAGFVIATTSDEMAEDVDGMTVDLTDWIITLEAKLIADNGLKIIEENPELITNIRMWVGDLDVKAAYPTNETIFNISKETTVKEICSIEGISENIYRRQAINLSVGHTNAVEFCQFMFSMPSMEEMLELYTQTKVDADNIRTIIDGLSEMVIE